MKDLEYVRRVLGWARAKEPPGESRDQAEEALRRLSRVEERVRLADEMYQHVSHPQYGLVWPFRGSFLTKPVRSSMKRYETLRAQEDGDGVGARRAEAQQQGTARPETGQQGTARPETGHERQAEDASVPVGVERERR